MSTSRYSTLDAPDKTAHLSNDTRIADSESQHDLDALRGMIEAACRGLGECVNAAEVFDGALMYAYSGMTPGESIQAAILAARAKIETEPAYNQVAAQLLLTSLYSEVLGMPLAYRAPSDVYQDGLLTYVQIGVASDLLDPSLLAFDLNRLGAAIRPDRDRLFTYAGLHMLYDRYLIRADDRRIELPQIFWMRIAMGLALNEQDKEGMAIAFYELLSQMYFTPATPTLFYAGTPHPQISPCYLTTIADDLEHIFKCFRDNALLAKWAGGLGNDWTPVRALGARIKGTSGKSQGIIPFLKIANDTAVAINQGGRRKGAVCAYLEAWHLDIEEFLDLRKNTGDERRRTPDLNTANWIPDLFMKRVREGGLWTLFSPDEVPDLHDLYGKAFEQRYIAYERHADEGKIKLFKRLPAVELWRKMLTRLFETGHPWITWKDPSNVRSPQDHAGVIHSSNLCTEILLNSSINETGVCNLASVNLPAHIVDGRIDEPHLAATIRTAVRLLDNMIDVNHAGTSEAHVSNQTHRPVGLGLTGFQDALYMLGISYASPEAVEFADRSMELIAYYAILASAELAHERGTYATYWGSKWDRGLLPFDTIPLLEAERGEAVAMDSTTTLDWEKVRAAVRQHGMRNSTVLAIAPTVYMSAIVGDSPSIEPTYKNLYAKSSFSGELTQVNSFLVDDLKRIGLWDAAMLEELKYYDGSIQKIARIPDELKRRYLTAFEIEPEWLIECASRRQKWIDMSQSLNLYLAEPSGKRLHEIYFLAWQKGLKTTYYLRTLAVTQVEKSTLNTQRWGNQPRWLQSQSPSIAAVGGSGSPAELDTVQRCPSDDVCDGCQ